MKKITLLLVSLCFTSSFTNAFTGKPPVNNIIKVAGNAESIALEIATLMNEAKYDLARKNFSPELKSALTATQMKQVWVNAQFQMGKITSFGNPETEEIQGMKKVSILVNYEKGKAILEVNFDESNQVQGLWLKPVQ